MTDQTIACRNFDLFNNAAYNLQMTAAETAIEDGAEVAFFPPVTGG
jgi:molybdopterin converting factor small subunit